MKRNLLFSTILIALGITVSAQNKAEVSIKLIENGKVVKDTTYTYNSIDKAEHALKILDAVSDAEIMHMDKDNHVIIKKKMGHDHQGENVFISEDGEEVKVFIKESKKCKGKKNVEVTKKVIVISDDEDGKSSWTINEDEDAEVIIIKKGDEGDEDVEVEVIVKEKKMVKDDKYEIKKPAKKKVEEK